jgi:1-acyl-sn-glycerol-3-phosphate acyltransferase
MHSAIEYIFNVLRSIAMLKSIINAAMWLWYVERSFQFFIGPIIKLLFKIDYDIHPKMIVWRQFFGALVSRNILNSGFIKVVTYSDGDVGPHRPYVFGYTHASNLDPLMLSNFFSPKKKLAGDPTSATR